ncbi:MAG: peptidoglycan DD-metalloendopeptidase family protein [Proteobacteria bacterium]|nr:peptidoglycan DD-metalloendopeptidase family protein [Pseudomonadota bacterium]
MDERAMHGRRAGAGAPLAVWCAMALLIAGCASDYQAPIEQKPALPSVARATPAVAPRVTRAPAADNDQGVPAVHVVASGDKLLTIAWRYGLDVRDLVRWNQLSNPDLIVIGQALRLRPPPPPPVVAPRMPSAPPSAAATAPRVAPLTKPAPRISMAPIAAAPSAPPATAPTSPSPRAAPVMTDNANDKPMASDAGNNVALNKAGVRWMWPTQGKVSAADAGSVTKGIDIRGARGQAVKAAAGGTVVYSGSGLRGYGELIIIQHNDTFLSAYAHNEARLVQEGRHVDAGETIARMGNSDTTDVMLHFEIRRNGKAVDPLQYLPNR